MRRGAFTGANNVKTWPGWSLRHRGTLFLDEIADLDLNLQSKLLHFLQDGTFSRIGEPVAREKWMRGLICATKQGSGGGDERGAVSGQDLYYRIHVFRLKMPAFAARRRDDVPLLRRIFSGNSLRDNFENGKRRLLRRRCWSI